MTETEKIQGTINSLFFFNSKVSDLEKEKIAKWYLSLSTREKNNVEILMKEARDEANFDSYQGDI